MHEVHRVRAHGRSWIEPLTPTLSPLGRGRTFSGLGLCPMINGHGSWGTPMRRRLEVYIPIVLLVVLVQLIAPVSAFRVIANLISDPLSMTSSAMTSSMAAMCSGSSDSADGHVMPASGSPAHGGCCAACTNLGHPAFLDPPPTFFVKLHRQYQLVVWLAAEDATLKVRIGSNTQARAPPVHS